MRSLRHRLCWGLGIGPLNRELFAAVTTCQPDIVWVEKGLFIRPETLIAARAASNSIFVNYNTDDPFGNVKFGWRLFTKSLPLYDYHFVARAQNVDEYRARGAQRVSRFHWAFHERMHFPRTVSPEERTRLGGPIGFIGDYELERASCMNFLAQGGLKVRVWGPNWHKCPFQHPNLQIQRSSVWADDYARAICSFDINLGFLRKVNRDLSTTRSLEIPASGGFFLAERTVDHASLFEEGKEAEFFSSQEELLEKAKFYLQNPDKRRAIAERGRQKCLEGGYSYEHRLENTLEVLRKEFPHGRVN